MNGPVCKTVNLLMTERQGIEIDYYCPQCRGVWLDGGELDKLIEKGAAPASRPAPSDDRAYADRRPGYDSGNTAAIAGRNARGFSRIASLV